MNLPNKLTFSRIMLIPVMMFFYLFEGIPSGKIIAVSIFILAISTDFLDGYIARKYNLITDLGKFLDPIADKMIVTAGLLLLVADNTIPAPYGVIAIFIILARDFIVGVLRQMAAVKGSVIAADKMGKIKTVTQDFAIIALFYLSYANAQLDLSPVLRTVVEVSSYGLMAIAVFLTLYSGINYVYKNKNVLK